MDETDNSPQQVGEKADAASKPPDRQTLGETVAIELPPYAQLSMAGVDNAAIAALAKRFAMEDIGVLRSTLEKIIDRINPPPKAIIAWGDYEFASSLKDF